jgi:HD superfamily phosphodiesterase
MERIRSIKGLEKTLTAYYKEVKGQSMGEGAHGIAHARNTGRGARPVGVLLGAPAEAVKLATVSGYLHDFKRNDSENPVHKDEEASAEKAAGFFSEA